MKSIRIFLFVLIIIEIILLLRQKFLLPVLVDRIISNEQIPATTTETSKIPTVSLKLFTDFKGDNTFKYDPLVFTLNPTDNNLTKNWALNAKTNGLLLASLSLPKSYMPGTNFSDARFTVGSSDDPKAVKTCESEDSNNLTPRAMRDISGYGFKKLTFRDTGAGNFYDTISYRKTIGISCYVIEYTIHSTNMANYSPDIKIREFDKLKVQNELESLIESFHFGL